MATDKGYLAFITEQFAGTDGISWRPMMGEYVLYLRGRVIGGLYDDRLLLKPTQSAVALTPEPRFELPYDGAKEMLLVEDVEDPAFLRALAEAVYGDLPAPKKKGG